MPPWMQLHERSRPMSEFSRRVNVEIFEDEPKTFEEFVDDHVGEDIDDVAAAYRQYVDHFQPYRWHAKAANNKIVSDGESYFNEADVIETVDLLFGDDTTVYWMPMYGEGRGEHLLRYGKTDRDNQAAAAVLEIVVNAMGYGVVLALKDQDELRAKLTAVRGIGSLADALRVDAEQFIQTRADLVEALP
jgi:uncharacterized protein YegP (UPF0339 family)